MATVRGFHVRPERMSTIRALDNVGGKFFSAMSRYLKNSLSGSGVRFEAVVSGTTSGDVFSLMASYGSRMVDLCFREGLLVCSTKNWPFYVATRVVECLRRLKNVVCKMESQRFNRSVSIAFLCYLKVVFKGSFFKKKCMFKLFV